MKRLEIIDFTESLKSQNAISREVGSLWDALDFLQYADKAELSQNFQIFNVFFQLIETVIV